MKKHFAYNYARVLLLLFSLPFPTLIIVQLARTDSNLAAFLELGMYFLGSFWISIETFVQIIILKRVAELEGILESDYQYFKPENKRQLQFILAKNARLMHISKTVLGFVYTFAFLFILCPLLTNQSLTIPMWMPFENQEFSAYLYQSCYLLILCCVYPLLHNTFLGPILMATAQLQILKDNLLHATDRSELEDVLTQEKRIQDRLKRCVRQHNALLR